MSGQADPPGHSVLFDHGPRAGGTLFRAPLRILRAETADDVAPVLAAMARARAEGHWLAGYASYELGYVLSERLRPLLPARRSEPLLLFGVFEGHCAPDLPPRSMQAGTGFSAFEPEWDLARYRTAFDRVKGLLAAGDIYQANLTFPLLARAHGTPAALYAMLVARQQVPHGAFVDLGGPVLLSRSPELFFRVDARGRIETHPMKGTVARADDPEEDARRKEWLRTDPKNRAENLMIVDLMRNDLSRISAVGSVRVPALFQIESFATVHQMISRIEAQLLPGVTLPALFEALFPCGSVTGAPKIRAMEILRALETGPRGAYCGAIGWMAPSGAMEFNVAIRTIVLPGDGTARLNVGGGVVQDSTAEAEYEEALWKSRFATPPTAV